MDCNTCKCLGKENGFPYCHHYDRVYPEGRDIRFRWRSGSRKLVSDTCPKEIKPDTSPSGKGSE